MVDILPFLMLFLWQGAFLSIAYYTSKIRSIVKNVPYRGFFIEVLGKRINNDLLPVFDFTEYQEEELKKLNRRRNISIALFLGYTIIAITLAIVVQEEDMTIQYYNVYVSDSITPRAKIIQFFSNRQGRLLFRRVTVEGNQIFPQYSEILMVQEDTVFSLRPFYTADNPQIDTLKTVRFLLKPDTCIHFGSYQIRYNQSLMYYQQLPILDATDICSELCFDTKQENTLIFNTQKVVGCGSIPAKSYYDSNYVLLKEVGLEYEYYKIQSYIPHPSDRIIQIADSIKKNGFKWFPQEPHPAEIPKTSSKVVIDARLGSTTDPKEGDDGIPLTAEQQNLIGQQVQQQIQQNFQNGNQINASKINYQITPSGNSTTKLDINATNN